MRLARLDLTRYGHFTGGALDFGPARARDVTIVYGDNEAGKSTAFAAWLDLLFGIPKRLPPYAFLHPRSQMEIGARIETPDPLDLVRTGRGLADPAGHRLDETRLAALLHGLDRDAYRMRFSLDDETLRRGGEEIASAKGDLGQALHAGTSGAAGAGAALDALRAEVEAFHSKGARKTVLATAKAERTRLDQAIRADGLDPRRWDELDHAVEDAERAAADADVAALRAARTVALCETVAALAEIDGQLRRFDAELADLPGGPDLPPEAEADIRAALRTRDTVAEDRAVAIRDRDAAQAILDETPPDPDGLALDDEVARIDGLTLDDGTSLVGRMEGELSDLPKRQAALADQRAARDRALRQAGLDALPAIDGPALDRIDRLLAKAEQADRDLSRAATTAQRDEDAVPPEPPVPEGRDALMQALEALPDPARLADLERRAAEARAAADQAAVTLPADWRQRATGLPEDEDAEAALAALAEAETVAKTAKDQAAKALEARDEARAERDRAAAHPGAVGDDARARARRHRDALWDRHRAGLDAASADAFADAMRGHDDVTDRHAQGAAARAAHAAAEVQVRRTEQAAEQAAGRAEAARDAVAGPLARVRTLLDHLGVDDPSALRPRLRRLRAAANADLSAIQADADHAALRAVEAAGLDRLGHALSAIGVLPRGDLRRLARMQVDVLTEAATARVGYLAALARRADSRDARAACQVAADDAQATLRAALDGSAMADWSLADVRAAIAPLREALARQADCRGFEDRIDTITRAHDRLMAETADLPATDATDGLARLAAARRRGEAARVAARQRRAASTALAEVEDRLARLASRDAGAQAEIDRVLADQGGDGPVPDRLRVLMRRDVLRREHAAAAQREQALRAGVAAEDLAAEVARAAPGRLADLQAKAETHAAGRDTAREAVGAGFRRSMIGIAIRVLSFWRCRQTILAGRSWT
ncbi:MAG: AAA family ATPase, partial [Pseudomonadota bacterium]